MIITGGFTSDPALLAKQAGVLAETAAIKAVQLAFQKPLPQIGDIFLDASISEIHRASAKVTRHPIESEEGWQSTISDHIVVEPLTVKIDGIITNDPVEFLNALFSAGQDPVHDAHQTLIDNVLSGRVVTIVTSLLEYPDMVLENVEVTRDASKGNALHFTAEATQIVTVSTQETENQQRPQSMSTQSQGRASTQAASAPIEPTGSLGFAASTGGF